MTSKQLPVLFLDDVVLLPGMVLPIELGDSAQAAVDAAQSAAGGGTPELLVEPRLDGAYPSYGVIAEVEKVGKFRGGAPAAMLRTGSRALIRSA